MDSSLQHFLGPLTSHEEAILQGGYWHCTPPANFRRIVRSGAILPNLGRFRPRHSLSPQSKCARAGGISLFEPWRAGAGSWLLTWLTAHQPLTVALRLDPSKIRPQVLGRAELADWPGGIFLRGETCFCDPIPLEWCTGLLLIAKRRRREARWIEPFDLGQARAALREMAQPKPTARKSS